MSFKVIVGIIQIILSLILIISMIFGVTTVRSTIKENIGTGSAEIPSNFPNIDFSIITTLTVTGSLLIGILGILFLLQGIVNLIDKPQEEPVT